MDRATQLSPAQCQERCSSAPRTTQFCNATLSTISAQIRIISMVGLLHSPQIIACFDLPSYEVLSLGPASPLIIGKCIPRIVPDILHSAKDESMTWRCVPLTLCHSMTHLNPGPCLFASFLLPLWPSLHIFALLPP